MLTLGVFVFFIVLLVLIVMSGHRAAIKQSQEKINHLFLTQSLKDTDIKPHWLFKTHFADALNINPLQDSINHEKKWQNRSKELYANSLKSRASVK